MRILPIILVLVLVVVAPALCAAGIIAHPCECGFNTSCRHESDCSDDPCSIDVIVSRLQGRFFDSFLPILVATPEPSGLIADFTSRHSIDIDSRGSVRAGTPIHASDVPLLI